MTSEVSLKKMVQTLTSESNLIKILDLEVDSKAQNCPN